MMFSNASTPGEFRAGRLPMMMLQVRLRQRMVCVALISAVDMNLEEGVEVFLVRRLVGVLYVVVWYV